MIQDHSSRLDRRARTTRIARPVLTGIAGLGLIGGLAACTPAEAETGTDDGAASAAPSAAASSGTGGGSAYADGTYTAEGSYTSPGGKESIQVSLTLSGDVVSAVKVTPEATSGNAKQYQTAFASGIADEVVGVDIDDLSVDKVSGSSLTSDGFNAAVETIKADAAV
jgi:uncharacterized protein with FMN-binding domain